LAGIVCAKSISVPVVFAISIESDTANEHFNFLLGFWQSRQYSSAGRFAFLHVFDAINEIKRTNAAI